MADRAYYANILANTVLDGALDDTSTTFDVIDASALMGTDAFGSFTSGSYFDIRIENEIIRVNGFSGNTINSSTRGHGGTTAAAHASGEAVRVVISQQMATQIRDQNAPQFLANPGDVSGTPLNSRGSGAVDYQYYGHTDVNQVASGDYSGLFAGAFNKADGDYSFVGGGQSIGNEAAYGGAVGGSGSLMASGADNCFLGGGSGNEIQAGGVRSGVVAGQSHVVSASDAGCFAGESSVIQANATHAVVLGGYDHNIGEDSLKSAIVGGDVHAIAGSSPRSVIVGGTSHLILGNDCFIGGGDNHECNSGYSAIIGGTNHTMNNSSGDNYNNAIIGGSGNTMTGAGESDVRYCAIVGGGSISLGPTVSYGMAAGYTNEMSYTHYGTVIGNNNTVWQANASFVMGSYARSGDSANSISGIVGEFVQGIDNGSSLPGGCQVRRAVLRGSGSEVTSIVLSASGGPMAIPAGRIWAVDVLAIVANEVSVATVIKGTCFCYDGAVTEQADTVVHVGNSTATALVFSISSGELVVTLTTDDTFANLTACARIEIVELKTELGA